jgi:hypothetical protein
VDRKLGASENLANIKCGFASIFEIEELLAG